MMLKYATLLLLTMLIGGAQASPVFINDNRIKFLKTNPDLGQGYHLANNRLHGTCLKEIDEMLPTFDIRYSFLPISEKFLAGEPINKNFFKIDILRFIKKHFTKYIKTQNSAPPGKKVKNLAIIIEGHSAFAVLDELHSHFSRASEALIVQNRLGEFFNNCGYFFIRGFEKKSAFVGLIQYEDLGSDQKNESFENWIEQSIKKVNIGSQNLFSNTHPPFTPRLWFQYIVLGSSKSQVVQYSATSIQQIQKAIKRSVINIQAPEAGRLIGMEVRPWIDMAKFQDLIFELPDNIKYFSLISKNNMENNSAILSQIEGTLDTFKNIEALNNQCLAKLRRFESRHRPNEPLLFQNHNFPFSRGLAKKYRLLLSELNIEHSAIKKERSKYLNGSRGQVGALRCYNKIIEGDITSGNFLNFEPCKRVLSYSSPYFKGTENYCLPVPFSLDN